MQPSSPEAANWTPGRLGASVGTREWADFVRLKLVSHVEHLGEDDDGFLGYIELLKEHRAWSLLTKHDGSTFRTREEFCAYKRPWGLGTPWEKLRPFVRAAYAKRGMSEGEIDRALEQDGVKVAMTTEESTALARAALAAKREENHADAALSYCNTNSEAPSRAEQVRLSVLRAINRAPEPVQQAYREGRISQTLAAKLGPAEPDDKAPPDRVRAYLDIRARNEEIAREIVKAPDRKTADAIVRERLGVEAPAVVRLEKHPDRAAARLVERFGRDWCRDLVAALDAAVHREEER